MAGSGARNHSKTPLTVLIQGEWPKGAIVITDNISSHAEVVAPTAR
jgi:hypothetical protein